MNDIAHTLGPFSREDAIRYCAARAEGFLTLAAMVEKSITERSAEGYNMDQPKSKLLEHRANAAKWEERMKLCAQADSSRQYGIEELRSDQFAG